MSSDSRYVVIASDDREGRRGLFVVVNDSTDLKKAHLIDARGQRLELVGPYYRRGMPGVS